MTDRYGMSGTVLGRSGTRSQFSRENASAARQIRDRFASPGRPCVMRVERYDLEIHLVEHIQVAACPTTLVRYYGGATVMKRTSI